jgi:hypothetical protein
MLGVPVPVPRNSDGARGMAMLAAWGVQDAAGGMTLAETSARMRSEFDVVDPRSTAGFEDELYERFLVTLRGRGWLA